MLGFYAWRLKSRLHDHEARLRGLKKSAQADFVLLLQRFPRLPRPDLIFAIEHI